MHYITSIYTLIVKAHENAHVLIWYTFVPFDSSFHSYLSGLMWVFIPSKEFTYFLCIQTYNHIFLQEDPSESCYLLIKDNIGMRFCCCFS
jgi:hypothetical protein